MKLCWFAAGHWAAPALGMEGRGRMSAGRLATLRGMLDDRSPSFRDDEAMSDCVRR
jgi:hypothetical protein